MRKRPYLSVLLLLGCTAMNTGCASVMASLGEMTSQSISMFRPRSSDYRDYTDEVDDEWSIAGKEGRGDKAMEGGGDPLYSPKARSIERNLGIGLD